MADRAFDKENGRIKQRFISTFNDFLVQHFGTANMHVIGEV
jgi:hypothetical protein